VAARDRVANAGVAGAHKGRPYMATCLPYCDYAGFAAWIAAHTFCAVAGICT